MCGEQGGTSVYLGGIGLCVVADMPIQPSYTHALIQGIIHAWSCSRCKGLYASANRIPWANIRQTLLPFTTYNIVFLYTPRPSTLPSLKYRKHIDLYTSSHLITCKCHSHGKPLSTEPCKNPKILFLNINAAAY